VPELIRSLADTDVETQLYAVWALGAIGDQRAVDPIISKLEHATRGVRKMACFALGQIDDPRSIPSLKSALQDTTPDVTWKRGRGAGTARRSLRLRGPGLLAGPEAPGFASLSPDRQEEVMVSVLRSLAGIRDPEMRRVLRRLTKEDGSPRIRNEAQKAMGGRLPPTRPRS